MLRRLLEWLLRLLGLVRVQEPHDGLLLESGDRLLTESGHSLRLEFPS